MHVVVHAACINEKQLTKPTCNTATTRRDPFEVAPAALVVPVTGGGTLLSCPSIFSSYGRLIAIARSQFSSSEVRLIEAQTSA
jgi:hypothetical protein